MLADLTRKFRPGENPKEWNYRIKYNPIFLRKKTEKYAQKKLQTFSKKKTDDNCLKSFLGLFCCISPKNKNCMGLCRIMWNYEIHIPWILTSCSSKKEFKNRWAKMIWSVQQGENTEKIPQKKKTSWVLTISSSRPRRTNKLPLGRWQPIFSLVVCAKQKNLPPNGLKKNGFGRFRAKILSETLKICLRLKQLQSPNLSKLSYKVFYAAQNTATALKASLIDDSVIPDW